MSFGGLLKRVRAFTGPITVATRTRSLSIGGRNGISVSIPGARLFGGGSAGWRGISSRSNSKPRVSSVRGSFRK